MNQLNTVSNQMLFFQTKKPRRIIPKDIPPVVLHFRPDFEATETHQRVHNEIVKESGCVRIRVKNWREFIEALREEHPDFITIHQSVINLDHTSLKNFAVAIQSLIEHLPKNKYNALMPVAIGIESDSTQQFVDDLRRAGFAGIWPSAKTFGSKVCVDALKVFFSNQEYWPEDIIGQLPKGNDRPLHILFREDVHTYITPEMDQVFEQHLNIDRAYCANWAEVTDALEKGAKQMAVHISMLEHPTLSVIEILSMIATRAVLAGSKIAVMVGIEPTTPLNVVKDLKKSPAIGIIPSAAHWGPAETITACRALTNRQAYWPRHIIDQLPGAKKPEPASTNNNTNGIKLTVRQQEVMDLICNRGLSNKQIAKTLSLSESTVKIHVSAVMKSYGVRNRTQLALSAGTGLKA
jgi:DNA-binding NarL/FixJ family response regulator